MALFIIGMPCSICRHPIQVGHDVVATTHFIADRDDPLWRYSDSVMHRACFDQWESRDEFARRYRETMSPIYSQNRRYATWPGPPGRNVVKEPPAPPGPQRPIPLEHAGPCPDCGFAYRFDGATCSHCGHGRSQST